VPPPAQARETPRLELSGVGGVVVVSSRPRACAQQLRAHPQVARVVELAGAADAGIDVVDDGTGRAVAFVADADTWQSRWSALERVRASLPMVFDGCAVSEFRAITRLRALPPPLEPGADALWLKDAAGNLSRVRL
jgi:hypothetical protein